MLDSIESLAIRDRWSQLSSLPQLERRVVKMLIGFRRSRPYLVMRLGANLENQMQDLPILLHVDRTVVVVVVLVVVVRLGTSVVERRPVHVGVTTTRSRLLPRRRSILWFFLRWSVLWLRFDLGFGLGRCGCCLCRFRCWLVVVAGSVLAEAQLGVGNVKLRAERDIQIVEKILFRVVSHSDGAVMVGWTKRMERSRVQGARYSDLSALEEK